MTSKDDLIWEKSEQLRHVTQQLDEVTKDFHTRNAEYYQALIKIGQLKDLLVENEIEVPPDDE